MGIYELWKTKRRAEKAIDKFHFVVNNIRRERIGLSRVLTRKQKVQRALSVVYPPWRVNHTPKTIYDRIFVQGTKEHAISTLVRNVLMVELFGLLVYTILAFKYAHYPGIVGTTISLIVHIFLLYTLLFPKLMYYFAIAVHNMLSTKIRSLLVILIIVMALEGPALNVIKNIHGMASGVACIQNDVIGAKYDLQGNLRDKGTSMVVKVRQVLLKVAQPMTHVKHLIARLDEKATKFIDVMRRNYVIVAGLSNRCRRYLEGPYTKCVNFFDSGYSTCRSKARFFGSQGSACVSIQKTSTVCDLAKGFSSAVCSFPQAIKKGVKGAVVPFYAAYFNAVEASVKTLLTFHIKAAKWAQGKIQPALDEVANLKTLDVDTKFEDEDGEPTAEDDSTAALRASLKGNLMEIVNTYRNIVGWMVFIFRWGLLPALLIWPFIHTIHFIYNYNYDDEYKNQFITDEFVKIDTDCAFRGANKALPLTADESKHYVWRHVWRMTSSERTNYWLLLSLTVLACFSPLCLCLLDVGVYKTLYNVHATINMTNIEMPSHYELTVAGKGYMARFMREFLQVFSPLSKAVREREMRWRSCFKPPQPPNYVEYWAMFAMFTTSLFCCRLKVYMSRQTLALCDYYYPDRVRVRALSLFNRITQDRKNLLDEMMGYRKTDVVGDDLVVRRTMQSRGYLRSDCTKCGKLDLKVADQANVRVCIACGTFYCVDCFSFAELCTRCDDQMQNIGNVELYYEAQDDADEDESSAESGDEDDEESDSDDGDEDGDGPGTTNKEPSSAPSTATTTTRRAKSSTTEKGKTTGGKLKKT